MVIGPFLLPPMVFASLMGIIALMISGAILKKTINPRFDTWSGLAIVVAFVVARLAFVIRHWETYQYELVRALYIWQGGFEIPWAMIGAVVTLLFLPTWRYRLIGFIVLLITVGVACLAFLITPKIASYDLADLSLMSTKHEMVNLADHGDGPLVINLWATWCGPCRREMPVLQAALENDPDIQFYFINQGESESLVRNYLKEESLHIYDAVLFDPTYEVPRYYNTQGTPVTLFFDMGELQAMHVGEISAELLSDRLKQLRH